MLSSAVLGRKLGFHTSSAFTRVLVLNASDTCEAISDRRPGTALAKPFGARVGAVDHGVDGQLQAAGFERHVHDAIARLYMLDGGSGLAMTSLAPLVKADRNALMAAGSP